MKINYFIYLLLFVTSYMILSCSAEDDYYINNYSTKLPKAPARTINEAIIIAQNGLKQIENSDIPNSLSKEIDCDGVRPITNKHVMSRAGVSDTLLYVLNIKDNDGFVLVSANKATEGLVAIVEHGNFDDLMSGQNPDFAQYINDAETYIANVPAISQDSLYDYRHEDDTITTIKQPLISVMWDQNGVEAAYCPNSKVGCANLAMAMAMSYFEYPSSLPLTYLGRYEYNRNLSWHDMKLFINEDNTTAQEFDKQSIGHLCRELGERTHSLYYRSDYNSSRSSLNGEERYTSTTYSNVKQTLFDLGYLVSNDFQYPNDSCYSHLGVNSIILMEGHNNDDPERTQHMWVVDGNILIKIVRKEWVRTINQPQWVLLEETIHKHSYNHINWGWGGRGNGYFQDPWFFCDNAYEYDGLGAGYGSSHNYNGGRRFFTITKARSINNQ